MFVLYISRYSLLLMLSGIACSSAAGSSINSAPTVVSNDASVPGHGAVSSVHHTDTVGVFVGVTHAGRRQNGGALGFEYERRVSQHIGVGVCAEYTHKADLWVVAIPVAFHHERWKFLVAPGIEDDRRGKESLVRLGLDYTFPLSNDWEVAPKVNVDLVDGEDVWVFGVYFGRGF